MIRGKKCKNEDVIYLNFKKHYCPHCKTQLKGVKVAKVINYHSADAEKYSFRIGTSNTVCTGDVEFSHKELKCEKCNKFFSAEKMKEIEGYYDTSSDTDSKKISFYELAILLAIILGIALIVFLKFVLKIDIKFSRY